ncbi:10457_t:CDS:2, partial [Acaulospora colombiana]
RDREEDPSQGERRRIRRSARANIDNSVISFVEAKTTFVDITHNVDPIELSESRLGTMVYQKSAAVVAPMEVKSGDNRELSNLVSAGKPTCDYQ